MSFQAMAWACEQRVGSATAKFVLVVLANYADDDGVCWPSQETLAADTELTDRSIRNALGLLQELGLLKVTHRPGTGGGRKSNVYELRLPETISVSRRGNRKNLQGQPERNAGQPETVSDKPIIEPIKEPISNRTTAFDELVEGGLQADVATAVIEHRKAMRKPLTPRAARMLMNAFAKTADPNAAAEMMVARGWQGFDPQWMQNVVSHPSAAPRPGTWAEFNARLNAK